MLTHVLQAKDSLTSTTLRSVLSEVYAADKVAKDKVSSSTIASILRKAVSKRNDAVSKFVQASRQDLADGLLQEAAIIEKFLPPLLSATDIDEALCQAIAALPEAAQKSHGQIFKIFYQEIDRSAVDTNLVKQRLNTLLSQK
ncbi:hypothetical protein H2248_005066 [Termitomyces sp. 'cryptogamus']|nr:hypothetical protein H2248_005066 [Termitomyces sp. 'cryptogamus']